MPCTRECLVAQLCLTHCECVDCSLPGSSVHGILQARILEWVVISSSRGSSRPRDQTHVFCTGDGFFTCRAMQGHTRRMGHGEDFRYNVVYWRRKWQPTPVFLLQGPQEQCEKVSVMLRFFPD